MKHFSPQIVNEVKELIKSDDFNIYQRLKKYGWTNITDCVYESACHNYIFKRPFICFDEKIPNIAIPTKIFRTTHCGKWFLQPKADISYEAVEKAFEEVKKWYQEVWIKTRPNKYKWQRIDFHDGNVGLYQNKGVLIDW